MPTGSAALLAREALDSVRGREYLVPCMELFPQQIWLKSVSSGELVEWHHRMSSASWRPGPGRRLQWLVMHESTVIGMLQIGSPVMTLSVRDKFLQLPQGQSERGKALRHYADMGACVGVQPLSWYWNLGKLIAMIAPTLGPEWEAKYGDRLRGLTTTSVYGKSSQYNRVWKYLGLTKGYGNEQISDSQYAAIRKFLVDHDLPIPPGRRFAGRLGVITFYRLKTGNSRVSDFHGKQRGVYYHAPDSRPTSEAIMEWYTRWGYPRYCRTKDQLPPYENGTTPSKDYSSNGQA